jgi:ATP-binding protein involved in chromosome partitioning
MFEQTKVHPLGIIENMSYYVCAHCGEREDIFGHGQVAEKSEELGIPFLGEIPLDPRIRAQADVGVPTGAIGQSLPAHRRTSGRTSKHSKLQDRGRGQRHHSQGD